MLKTLLASVMIVALGLAARGQQPHYDQLRLQVVPLSGSLYAIEDAGEPVGGNIAALVGKEGVLLVDDDLPEMSNKVTEAIRRISDQPIRIIFNTHHHRDHSGGNKNLGKHALIFANENVAKNLRQHGRADIPNVLMSGNLELMLNGEKVRVVHYAAAHTDGDVAVYFENANIVHLGDMFFSGLLPFIDVDAGGSVDGLLKALDEIIASAPSGLRVMPGHGPISDVNGLKEYVDMLRDSAAIIDNGIKRNKSLRELESEKALGKYQKFAWKWGTLDEYTENIYKDRIRRTPNR